MPIVWTRPGLLTEPVTAAAGILDRLRDRHHPKLAQAEARVGLLFAANEDKPALTFARRPAAAIVRVLSVKLRLLTGYDALIEVDAGVWESLESDGQAALLDHELCHLAPVERIGPQDKPVVAKDDLGRPRLRIAHGDFYVGDGFAAVIERHGPAALEVGPVREAYALVTDHLPAVFARARPDRNGEQP